VSEHHPPVHDFATDFDHTDPAWVKDPFPIWDELRQSCPVAHSERYGGTCSLVPGRVRGSLLTWRVPLI